MSMIPKSELRKQMKQRNLLLSVEARQAAATRIFAAIERLPEFEQAERIGFFCALPDELPTEQTLRRWALQKQILLPRVEGERMQFYPYDPQTLHRGAFGIAEPSAEVAPCDPSAIDLVIVPGVAFTAQGDRMGRGKGFYDRYLSQPNFRARTIGVGYAHQVVEELPTEAHDVRLGRVVAK